MRADLGYLVAATLAIGAKFSQFIAERTRTSKKSAWLITAFTVLTLKGLRIKNVGSGLVPVNSSSGNAVMKITGISKLARMSVAA